MFSTKGETSQNYTSSIFPLHAKKIWICCLCWQICPRHFGLSCFLCCTENWKIPNHTNIWQPLKTWNDPQFSQQQKCSGAKVSEWTVGWTSDRKIKMDAFWSRNISTTINNLEICILWPSRVVSSFQSLGKMKQALHSWDWFILVNPSWQICRKQRFNSSGTTQICSQCGMIWPSPLVVQFIVDTKTISGDLTEARASYVAPRVVRLCLCQLVLCSVLRTKVSWAQKFTAGLIGHPLVDKRGHRTITLGMSSTEQF